MNLLPAHYYFHRGKTNGIVRWNVVIQSEIYKTFRHRSSTPVSYMKWYATSMYLFIQEVF